jgi:hypothetical protein
MQPVPAVLATWQHAGMSNGQVPPRDAGSGGRVVGCFLCGTFAPLPRRWKQGRLQLDVDGVRWGPGLRRRDGGLLLPAPLTIQAVRDVRGWERVHIKADSFQIIEVGTVQGEIRLAVPRERVPVVVDHIRASEQHL